MYDNAGYRTPCRRLESASRGSVLSRAATILRSIELYPSSFFLRSARAMSLSGGIHGVDACQGSLWQVQHFDWKVRPPNGLE